MSSTIEMTNMEDDTITFHARYYLWQQYAGPYSLRKCLYPWCNRMMSQDTFCVVYYDNMTTWDITAIQNMRPVCDVCYAEMRLPTMREWVDYMDRVYSMNPRYVPTPPWDQPAYHASSHPPEDHMES